MPIRRRVAFIRAVMIGRDGLHRELVLDLFREAGATDPRNHLTTGNVSFAADDADVQRIVEHVERGIGAVASRSKDVFVRDLEALRRLVPPAGDAIPPDGHLEIVFLPRDAPSTSLPLRSKSGLTAVFAATDQALWAFSTPPEAPGGLVERALGMPVTVRAWSTIRKIVAAH